MIVLASFSIEECFHSDPLRVLKKIQMASHFGYQTAAKAMLQVSVSNSKGWDLLMVIATDVSISDLSDSNAFLASSVSGNDFDLSSGPILSDNFGFH